MEHASLLCFIAFLILLGVRVQAARRGNKEVGFDQNYVVTWGQDHVLKLDQEREVQLSMDKSSGSGFASKTNFGSGFFQMRIKLPEKDSAGVVTAFYLTSKGNKHDELDFEFLGNREGKPITLQTNVFADGIGDREQRFLLWFDPTKGFHTYQLLWNQFQIVFYVDNIPIRVLKNNTNKGVAYPSKPMQIEASLWDGDSWATDGGQTKTNWSNSPFRAYFKGFEISGCPNSDPNNNQKCQSSNYWWNKGMYSKLSDSEEKAYEKVRNKYMNYDYCADRPRYPVPPKDCP